VSVVTVCGADCSYGCNRCDTVGRILKWVDVAVCSCCPVCVYSHTIIHSYSFIHAC
jgi:hypothetical protein